MEIRPEQITKRLFADDAFSLDTNPPPITQQVNSLNDHDNYAIHEVTPIEVFKQIHFN